MKITIITICYNSEQTIEDTIKSVLKQTYDNYEYLIIDGKSEDKTLDIVKQYEKKFKGKMKYISEKDHGLYDAINKGIKMASGDVIGLINSDDVLACKDVFKTIAKEYKKSTEVLYANVLYCDKDLQSVVRNYRSGIKNNDSWCPAHPTMYIRKEVFDKVGYYNQQYRVAADYDYMVRLNKSNAKFQYIDKYLVLMRIGGVSNGLKGYLNNFKDAYNILKVNKVSFPFFKTSIRSIKTIIEIFSKHNKEEYQKVLETYNNENEKI